MHGVYAIRYGDKAALRRIEIQAVAQCMSDIQHSITVWQLQWWKETNLFKVLLGTKEDELHNLCLCHTGLYPLCLCAYAQMYSATHADKATMSVFVPVMHVCTHVIAFFMIQCAHLYLCTPRVPPSLMWPRWVWKGNLRTQDPQCCSHLRPLMMGQRVSRPNHGRLSLTHTRTRAQWPFIVVSADLKPVHLPLLAAALMRSCYDGGWMGVMQRWRLCELLSPSLISPSLPKLQLFPKCKSVFSNLKPHTPCLMALTIKLQLFVL